jgi:hypothetical protein
MIQVNKWGVLCVVCGTFCRVLSEEKREKRSRNAQKLKKASAVYSLTPRTPKR